MNFFSKKPTAKEAAMAAKKETRKEVRSSQRDMDREIRELERQEKQVTQELKQRAKTPGVNPAKDSALKALAKQLVAVRQQREKLYAAKAHIGAVGMHASSMASQVAAASAIGSVATAMSAANNAVDAKQMTKIMTEFTKQNETLAVKEEMMNDALIDAFDNDELEDEADNIASQVLAELGVEMDAQFAHAPMMKPVAEDSLSPAEQAALDDALPDLKARLNAL
jgi:charged multivesicular body protein 2B